MPKQLTVHNATVTTVAVSVKTLTISGKQVTLAVFRQLREEPLIAHDGTLNGVPWGYVNYHPGNCGGNGHWHVVWQQGEELLRSRIEKEPEEEPHSEQVLDMWITAATLEHLEGRPSGFTSGSPITKATHQAMDFKGQYVSPSDASRDSAFYALQDVTQWRHGGSEPIAWTATAHRLAVWAASLNGEKVRAFGWGNEEKLAASEKEALESLSALIESWDLTFSEIRTTGMRALRFEVDRRQRHRDLRKALANLPQLFIAV